MAGAKIARELWTTARTGGGEAGATERPGPFSRIFSAEGRRRGAGPAGAPDVDMVVGRELLDFDGMTVDHKRGEISLGVRQ
jgi:hypothetical protein